MEEFPAVVDNPEFRNDKHFEIDDPHTCSVTKLLVFATRPMAARMDPPMRSAFKGARGRVWIGRVGNRFPQMVQDCCMYPKA